MVLRSSMRPTRQALEDILELFTEVGGLVAHEIRFDWFENRPAGCLPPDAFISSPP